MWPGNRFLEEWSQYSPFVIFASAEMTRNDDNQLQLFLSHVRY